MVSGSMPTLDHRPQASVTAAFEMITGGFKGPNSSTQIFSDRLTLHSHTGTHIDALAHWAVDGLHFQGAPAEVGPQGSGMSGLGVDVIPPILTRGLLIDLVADNGGAPLKRGAQVEADVIDAYLSERELSIQEGDVVLIRTGWAQHWTEPQLYMSGAPGLTEEAARSLCDHGCIAIGMDQWSIDAMPPTSDSEQFIVHTVCLVQRGVYLIENLDLEMLGRLGQPVFAFVLLVVPVLGATGFPVQPVALVEREGANR
ncbi:MAG TPA: cyclase family protein [Rhodothermales bacterium]|nr:cyclase family protein [Rhodothermales bacterium]